MLVVAQLFPESDDDAFLSELDELLKNCKVCKLVALSLPSVTLTLTCHQPMGHHRMTCFALYSAG